MKKGVKLLKVGITLLLLIFLTAFTRVRNKERIVKSERIKIDNRNENPFINDSTILNVFNAGVLPLNQTKISGLSVSNFERWMQQNPYIRSANVYVDLNGGIYTSVIKEVPVARVKTPSEEFYLSEQGESIPLSNQFSAKVVLVTGAIEPSEYKELSQLVHQINADKLLKKHIIGISKQPSKSFTLFVNKGSYKIILGSINDSEIKLRKLKLFYEKYMGKVALNKYSEINLRYKNQIVATKHKI